MRYSPTSRLCTIILLSTLFSNTLNLYSFRSGRDHVSQPNSATRKIIVLYTLIFKFYRGYRKTGDSKQNGSKNSPV
jgi:hypothetical protein